MPKFLITDKYGWQYVKEADYWDEVYPNDDTVCIVKINEEYIDIKEKE